MNIVEDFKQKYGEEAYKDTVTRAGHHNGTRFSTGMDRRMGVTENERLAYALLEVLDYDCIGYDCYTHIESEDEVRSFLVSHKTEISEMEIDPPSFIGMMCGVFDFLSDTLEPTITDDNNE